MTDQQLELDSVQRQVRERYAGAAIAAAASASKDSALPVHAAGCCGDDAGCGCGDACCSGTSAAIGIQLYDVAERAELPDAAVLASLGCGNPLAVAELREGETVLDLGSGGGIDVLLSARRVGPSGRAIGVDMTDEMLALARANQARAGVTNVEFLKGTIEDVPLPDGSVDVVISNCVINLSTNKPAVIREMFRVLKPAGRL